MRTAAAPCVTAGQEEVDSARGRRLESVARRAAQPTVDLFQADGTPVAAPVAPDGARWFANAQGALRAPPRAARLHRLPNLGDGGRAPEARPPVWEAPGWLAGPRRKRLRLPFTGRWPAPTGQSCVLGRLNQRSLDRLGHDNGSGRTLHALFEQGHCTALASLWLHHKALGSEPAFHARLARIGDGTATDGDHDKLANALHWLKYNPLSCGLLQDNALSPLDAAVGVRRTAARVAQQDAPQFAAWLRDSLPAGHMAFLTANLHACGLMHGHDGSWSVYDPNQFGEEPAADPAGLAALLRRALFLESATVTVSNFYVLDDDLAAAGLAHALPYDAETQPWEGAVPYTQEAWHLALAFQNPDAIAALLPQIPAAELGLALCECIDLRAASATDAVVRRMRAAGQAPSRLDAARAIRLWPEGLRLLPLPADLDAAIEGAEGNLLACAAAERQLSALRALLDAGASPSAVAGRFTALGEAARNGDMQALRLLLDAGADPNAHAPGAAPPLLLAAQEHHLPAVEALLSAGARLV